VTAIASTQDRRCGPGDRGHAELPRSSRWSSRTATAPTLA